MNIETMHTEKYKIGDNIPFRYKTFLKNVFFLLGNEVFSIREDHGTGTILFCGQKIILT